MIVLITLTSACLSAEFTGDPVLIINEPDLPLSETLEVVPSDTVPATEQSISPTSHPPGTKVSTIDGMPMVYIPAGIFQMGSEDGFDDESPLHDVYLDDFWIDQNEVTFSQFLVFMEQSNISADPKGIGDHYPVTNVTWTDAEAYCAWAERRLPTEAEWEKAARGGLSSGRYPWGDEDPVCEFGAINGAQYDECDGETVVVGSFAPNGYELYDMVGNVWEWVADWYDPNYYHDSPSENPPGPTAGEYRVMRGGSWDFYGNYIQTSYRGWYPPLKTLEDIGFRCAQSAENH